MKLNKELLEMQDPKDLEILKLKRTIEAFKKYDKKRKEYLQKIQWELEDVSQQYVDLKGTLSKDVIEIERDYKEKMKTLKTNLAGQSKTICELKRLLALLQDEEKLKRAEEILKRYKVIQLKEMNEKLEKEVQRLRKTNSELVARLVQSNKQNNETEN